MVSFRGKRSMASVSKRSRVCFASVRMEGQGEKRSWVSDVVAEVSWVKRERSREVALMGGVS